MSTVTNGPGTGGVRTPRLIAGVFVLAALAVLAYFAYTSLSGRQAAVAQLNEAITMLERTDQKVASVDRVLSSEVTAGVDADAERARSDARAAAEQLDEVVATANEAIPNLPEAERRRARALQDAVQARKRMMTTAPEILATSAKAARALPKAESAWALVVEADKLSDRAVGEYNKLTRAGVQASLRLNKQAADRLQEARTGFVAAEDAFPEASLERFVSYVDARIALNGLSRRSDTAWLKGDIAEANRLIDSYNAQDKEVVAQAKGLASSTAAVIANAFEEKTAAPFEKYYDAREDATRADERIKAL